jgi:small nuclear ribonucleoprotein (snRNP)-like protein
MLIEAPYKNGDIVTLKLTSGEELIGKLEEEKTLSNSFQMYISNKLRA